MENISGCKIEDFKFNDLNENTKISFLDNWMFQHGKKGYSCTESLMDDFLLGPGKSIKDFLYPDSKESFQNNVWSNKYNYIKVAPGRSASDIEITNRSPTPLSSQSSSICVAEKYWTDDLMDLRSESNATTDEKSNKYSGDSSSEDVAPSNEEASVGRRYDIEKIKKFSKEILEDPVIEENFQMLLNVTYSNMAELGYNDLDSYMRNHKDSIKSEDISSLEVDVSNCASESPIDDKGDNIDVAKEEELPEINQVPQAKDHIKPTNKIEKLPKIKTKAAPLLMHNMDIKKTKLSAEMKDKLRSIHLKTSTLVANIIIQIASPITEVDGSMDATRRQKRDAEFCSRFSRQFSYQLTRQIQELPHFLVMKNQSTSIVQEVCQRILSLYQIIVQGLQVYSKHIPESLCTDIPLCVCGLLNRTVELTDISLKYVASPSGIDLKNNISSLMNQRRKRVVGQSASQKAQSATNKKKEKWLMYKAPQKKESRKNSSKVSKKITTKTKSREKFELVRDSDVETAMSKTNESMEMNETVQVRSAPNLGNPVNSEEAERLFAAIRYKKKLLKLMKQNPLASLQDRVWEMVYRVVTQLLNEFLLDLTKSTVSSQCEEDSEF